MTQLSRRYLIALAAVAALAAIWFLALGGRSGTSHSSSSAASAPASTSPGAPSPVYHGSAPGVEGLTRVIDKAHAAVAESEQEARRLGGSTSSSSAHTGGASAPASTTGKHTQASSASARSPHPSKTAPVKHGSSAPTAPAGSHPSLLRKPARQAIVERALKEGKVAVLLFWNPKGSDDVAVREELEVLEAAHHLIKPKANVPAVRRLLKLTGLELQKPIAVLKAHSNQVTSFGSITRTVRVYQTPTIVIVNPRGQLTTLSGLTDAYSIEQAIDEARNQ